MSITAFDDGARISHLYGGFELDDVYIGVPRLKSTHLLELVGQAKTLICSTRVGTE